MDGFVAGVRRILVSLILVFALLCNLFNGQLKAVDIKEGDLAEVKNVIFLIGDGMGFNTLRMAEQLSGEDLQVLDPDNNFGGWDYIGASKTRSATNAVTDSAAGATALSCGVRTVNRYLCVYTQDMNGWVSVPANVTELAFAEGRRAGVISSDDSYGATPAGFTIHCSDRGNSEEICRKQLATDFNLIWTAGCAGVEAEEWEENGWLYLTNESELNALTDPDAKSYGLFDKNTMWNGYESDENPTLTELTLKAIDLLNTDNENGFFMMVEGAHIDKNSHSNNAEGCVSACFEFDRTVKAALDFAAEDGNTLVVVTADHETGDIRPEADGKLVYHSGSHSAADVPVFVYGSEGFMEDGQTILNIDVSRRVAASMGFYSDCFPLEVKTGKTVAEALAAKRAA